MKILGYTIAAILCALAAWLLYSGDIAAGLLIAIVALIIAILTMVTGNAD